MIRPVRGPEETDSISHGVDRDVALYVRDSFISTTAFNDTSQMKEEFYRLCFESSMDIICLIDSTLRIQCLTPSLGRVFGCNPSEREGTYIYEVENLLPQYREKIFQEMTDVISGKILVKSEYCFLTQDGRKLFMEIDAEPLVNNGTIAGALVSLRDVTGQKLVEDELNNTLGSLRRSLDIIIKTISRTVESRDPYTSGHQHRVSDLARSIAREMALPADVVDGIRMAGVIHDVGKVSVPSEILSKPGKLHYIETKLIQIHPKIGFEIIRNIDFPWPVAGIVLQHHERMDGSGYPYGLVGEDILLEARIISVADVVEAMSSHRPYRASLGIEDALREVESGSGRLYDPDVVQACAQLIRDKGYTFR